MLGHRTLNVEDYLAILKRRWWIVVIPAAVVPVAAVISTYFLTPRYDSTSLILIDQQKVAAEVVKPVDVGTLQSRLALITAQIESRSTLEPIINKYNLYASEHISMDARVDQFRKKDLRIDPIETEISGANGLPGFKVTFSADDPHTAQEVCADITGLYTRNSLLDQQQVTTGTTEFLQTQLNDETRKLNDIDTKKAQFESKYMGSLPGDAGNSANMLNSLSSRMDALNQQITNLQQNKTMQETMLGQLTQAQTTAGTTVKMEQADELQLDKLRAQLADLQSRYSDDYPDVKETKREIAELEKQIVKQAATPAPAATAAPHIDTPQIVQLRTSIKLIDQSIADKTKEEAQLQAQMRSYEGRISASPEVEQQYNEITRDYQTELASYNKLLEQMNQSNMATALQNRQEGENFTVLDMANLPTDATFPKPGLFALGGLAGGIALGVFIIAFLEYRDTALRTERDVWAFTQLPTLAVIAYSGEVADSSLARPGLLKRLFIRKRPKELLAG